jgi:ribosome-associated toxin RatA of RatAB toxin-antitoxin module
MKQQAAHLGSSMRHQARAGLAACLLCGTLLVAPAAQAYEAFSIEASPQNGAVALQVEARVRARHAAIWSALTDYERLPQFVPCIRESRVVERRGNAAVVEQKGSTKVAFFSFDVDVTVESQEVSPELLSVRVLKGNLRQLEGAYRIKRVPGSEDEYLISWRGVIEPDFNVPAFITVPLMRASLRDQFLAMMTEIERRETALRRTESRETALRSVPPSAQAATGQPGPVRAVPAQADAATPAQGQTVRAGT